MEALDWLHPIQIMFSYSYGHRRLCQPLERHQVSNVPPNYIQLAVRAFSELLTATDFTKSARVPMFWRSSHD